MRSALLASLALTATLTSAFAPSIAEACGGYMPDPTPQVFAVQTHRTRMAGGDMRGRRAFVMLARAEHSDIAWTPLVPDSFDTTRIGGEATVSTPSIMTLVGPSGTEVVSADRRAVLSRQHRDADMFNALEVAVGADAQFRIALPGKQSDAKWLATTDAKTTNATIEWVKSQGIAPGYVDVDRIAGTQLRVISVAPAYKTGVVSFIWDGGTQLGQYTGRPIGGLELRGLRYILLEQDGLITPVRA